MCTYCLPCTEFIYGSFLPCYGAIPFLIGAPGFEIPPVPTLRSKLFFKVMKVQLQLK